MARTVTRHILIRAENFIAHARGLRRPLNDAGYDTRHFHRTKEAYATAFEEYFLTSRHKLGAHVQDFDFGKRINCGTISRSPRSSSSLKGRARSIASWGIWACRDTILVPLFLN